MGKTVTFSSLWSDDYSLSGGGYVFSTNNSGQWVNASWVAFSSTPCWGNATLTLNSKVGAVVGFREFANNSLGLWGDSGIYTITTTNDTSTVTPSPAPRGEFHRKLQQRQLQTTAPTVNSNSQTPTPSPTTSPETNLLTTQNVAYSLPLWLCWLPLFALAFKKGYIKIEVVDEQRRERSRGKSRLQHLKCF